MEWKRFKVDGPPPCDGETVFVGVNVAGFCGCFNQHGMMSLLHGPMSICFYDTAEGTHEVMTCLDFWAALDVPNAQGSCGPGLDAAVSDMTPKPGPIDLLYALSDRPCETGKAVLEKCVRLPPNA